MKPRSTEPQANNPEDIAKRRWSATRCSWQTNGRMCLLTGTASQDTGGVTQADGRVTGPRCFCPFHLDALSTGNGASDSRAFMDWLEQHLATFPQSDYTRYGMDALWAAAIGNKALPVVEQGKPDNRRATAAQKAAAFAKIDAVVNKRFAPPELDRKTAATGEA